MRPKAERYGLLEHELRMLLHQYGIDADTRTPDYVLAPMLIRVLRSYAEAVETRDAYHQEARRAPMA